MRWTPGAVEAELDRLEPVLKGLGLRRPFQRARHLAAVEESWEREEVQRLWESRVLHWREVLAGDRWEDLLDLERPELQAFRQDLEAGGGRARGAWAAYIAGRAGLQEHLQDDPYRRLLFETEAWELYDPEGAFLFGRAEDMLAGRLRQLGLEPVQRDAEADYDWLIAHPKDRLFQNAHQSAYTFMYLALAHFHRPEARWAQAWAQQILAFVDQCPRLPDGYHDFGSGWGGEVPANVAWAHYGYAANRLHFLVPTYLVMKDRFSSRFHEVVLRAIRAHARHLHELGSGAFRDNYLSAAGKALYLTAALLPELKESRQWLEGLWPPLCAGMRRELLGDGCHFHRSFSYHLTFVERPLAMVCTARKLGRLEDLPGAFLDLTEGAAEAFARVCTPIRSTPGINDDWTSAVSRRELLGLAAEAFAREDWRYLATDGQEGRGPEERSALLPEAQVVAMRSDGSQDARYLFFNVSPDGGHHHPDTLSIQIWAGGRPLLIDPGTGHYYTGEREFYRRSWWHNCPTLGPALLPEGLDPKVLGWETGRDLDYAVGQVTVNGGTIRRHVFFVDRQYWVLWDDFEGMTPGAQIWENFHFPTEEVRISEAGRVVQTLLPEGTNLLMCAGQGGWEVASEAAKQWLSYGGEGVPTRLLHYRADGETAARGFAALFVPFEGAPEGTGFAGIERFQDGRVRMDVMVRGRRFQVTTSSFS